MARGYRNRRRKRAYRKKQKKGTINYKKLMDRAINTKLEQRMVEISQANITKLVNRKWLTTAPNQLRNAAPIMGPLGENLASHPYQDITSTPFVSGWIDVIKAADINQPLNNPDLENPDQAGVTRGMITESLHGYRTGNSVKIKGISLDIRIISDFGLEALHNADNNTALEIIGRNFKITRGQITLQYKVVLVSVSQINAALPAGDEVAVLALNYNNWGYTPQIDVAVKEEQRIFKYKTLMSGFINCSPQISFSKHGRDAAPVPLQNEDPTVNIIPYFREIKQYKEFNPPIQIDYKANDQNGKNKTRQAIYFIAKSNYDNSSSNDPADQSACPRIAVISKAYYFDN